MLPEKLELSNPLWDFSLRVYPELAEPLLELQAQGARVNQLLSALWCTETGLRWPGAVASDIEIWHQSQVMPIRERRIALKPQLSRYPELEALYQHLKAVELNFERVELAMLYHWLIQNAERERTALEVNLLSVLGSTLSEHLSQELTERIAKSLNI